MHESKLLLTNYQQTVTRYLRGLRSHQSSNCNTYFNKKMLLTCLFNNKVCCIF